MKNFLHNRKGSAIAFALFIAVTLLLSEFFLLAQNNNNIIVRQKNLRDLQSHYAAKAALQHALLKCQLMPTQLYDAASFAAGRNPYFDFGQYQTKPASIFASRGVEGLFIKLANNVNPGPRFTSTVDESGNNSTLANWTEVTGFSNVDLNRTSNVNPWPNGYDHNPIPNPSLYLWKYYQDINFRSDNFTNQIPYPYYFNYDALDLSVLSIQGQRKYKEEAVKVTVVGRAYFKEEEKETTISTIVRIKRNE